MNKKRLFLLFIVLALSVAFYKGWIQRAYKGRYEIISWISASEKKLEGTSYLKEHPLDSFDILIKPEDLEKIEKNVADANSFDGEFWKGNIYEHKKQKAEVIYNTLSPIKGKVKLGGAMKDHVNTDLWTIKCNLKDTLPGGLDRFMLMHPKTRNYTADFVCQEFMKKEGLLAPVIKLVSVKINTKHKGMYLYEEVYCETFLKANGKPKGIIFEPTPKVSLIADTDNLNDLIYSAQYEAVSKAIDLIYKGETNDYLLNFDYEKWGVFYALCDLVNDRHALWTGNIKCYYNSETHLIEPIGREWNIGYNNYPDKLCSDLNSEELSNDKFHEYIFGLKDFRIAYEQALTKFSKKEYLNGFFQEKDGMIDIFILQLNAQYPLHYFTRDYFYRNQEYIADRISNNTIF